MKLMATVTLGLVFLSLNLFAQESFQGQFEINKTQYGLKLNYSILKNQVATQKYIRIFEESTMPETNETLPAFCQFEMQFPFDYSVEIVNLSSGKSVFKKQGVEVLNTYAFGGFLYEGSCEWNIGAWKNILVSNALRITENDFLIAGHSFRFTIDTRLTLSTMGLLPNDIIATDSTPQKNTDGIGDGEVWFDTMPDSKGDYQRTYFRLFK